MSTHNGDGQVYLCCDECGAETPAFDSDDFLKLVAAARGDGWHIKQDRGEWSHACPDCNVEHDAVAKARRKFGLR